MMYLDTTYPVARKAHYCTGCCGQIDAGEKYTRHSHAYEGSIISTKLHTWCHLHIREWAPEGEFFEGDALEWAIDTKQPWIVRDSDREIADVRHRPPRVNA